MTSAGTLHKPAPKSPPGCPWWGHSAVPHHPQGFGPAAGLHCKHLHTLISHRHGKHLCCQLTKEHPGMETHTKVSVITIWKQDQPILQLLPQNMGISSLFGFFFNSDRLLNSCSNLQTACASTQNTAEDKKKTRLLELHMPVVRGFLELHMSPQEGIYSYNYHRSSLCLHTEALCLSTSLSLYTTTFFRFWHGLENSISAVKSQTNTSDRSISVKHIVIPSSYYTSFFSKFSLSFNFLFKLCFG